MKAREGGQTDSEGCPGRGTGRATVCGVQGVWDCRGVCGCVHCVCRTSECAKLCDVCRSYVRQQCAVAMCGSYVRGVHGVYAWCVRSGGDERGVL